MMFGWVGRSSGVIYLLLLERYNASATFTAYANAVPLLLWGVLGKDKFVDIFSFDISLSSELQNK